MLIKTSYRDVPTKADGRAGTMRIYIIEPKVPEYPDAKFPGCECAALHCLQGNSGAPYNAALLRGALLRGVAADTPGVVFSEIYQVTGPVERFAGNIASEGYVVALPSSFHEFEGPEAIPYDTEGTDRGNKYKVGSADNGTTLTSD